MESSLQICLLGRCAVSVQGVLVSGLDSPRLQGLLGYLALHRGAPLSRAQIAFQLWPDSTEVQALANLRGLLRRLRLALPQIDELLRSDRQSVTWDTQLPCSLDVADFHAALHAAQQADQLGDRHTARTQIQEAIHRYQGDLLPGLYDEWVLAAREALRESYLRALERLALLAEQEGDDPAAIAALQQLIRLDSLRESGHRALIRLYARIGDRAAALRAYHTCVTTLERELGAPPSPATREEYERVRQAVHAAPLPNLLESLFPGTTFVGRQPEWAALQACWRRASVGAPALVLLSGEAGLGKTRLAEEFAAWVRRQGIATAAARCYTTVGAFGPVTLWLRADPIRGGLPHLAAVWRQELARLLPELRADDPDLTTPGPISEPWQREQLLSAMTHAVGRCRPLLLLLDDVQWCDHETLAWLHALLRSDVGHPILLLATMRVEAVPPEHPVQALLADLDRAGRLNELPLTPLSSDETSALAGQLAGQPLAGELQARIYAETEGNPLFITELLRAGLPQHPQPTDLLPPAASRWPMPPRMQRVLGAHLNLLSPAAQELAAVAATIGRSFTIPVLHHAAGLNEEQMVACLDELWLRRVIREQGIDTYDFSHDKLREVAYGRLSLARRRLLHRRVAEALEAEEQRVGLRTTAEIAHHLGLAGLIERAIPRYRQAAQEAIVIFAYTEGEALLRQGLALLGDRRLDLAVILYEDLGDLLLRPGRVSEAEAAYTAAAGLVPAHDDLTRARLQRKQGACASARHAMPEALAIIENAAVILGMPDATASAGWRHEWIENVLARLWLYYHLAQATEQETLQATLDPVVAQHGTPLQHYRFLHVQKALRQRRERFRLSAATLALAEEMLALTRRLGDRGEQAHAGFSLGFTLLWHGNPQGALAPLAEAVALNERLGDQRLQVRILTYQAIAYRHLHDLTETEQYATAALTCANEAQLGTYIGVAQANLGWVAWRRGDNTRAATLAAAGLERMGHGAVAYPFLWLAIFPLLAVHTDVGHLEQAVALIPLLANIVQQPLPALLTDLLQAALQHWTADNPHATRVHLNQALEQAHESGYL